MSLRVRLSVSDPIRRHGLAAMLAEAGHTIVSETPDVVLHDGGTAVLGEAEAPVLVMTDDRVDESRSGVLPRDATFEQIDAALRAVAVGLVVRVARSEPAGFAMALEDSPLTPRETEILGLIGQGLSNKSIARRLGISVHTVKFHIEAMFGKLDATSRAEAVAKGLVGGVIEL